MDAAAGTGARLARLLGNRRVEVRVFFRHPVDKFAHRRIGEQPLDIHPVALQLAVAELGDQHLLADRMHRHSIAPAPAFRYRMMPDNGLPGYPPAKPADRHLRRSFLLVGQILIATMFRMFAGHVLGSRLVGGEGDA
jgi:hypothetical protein